MWARARAVTPPCPAHDKRGPYASASKFSSNTQLRTLGANPVSGVGMYKGYAYTDYLKAQATSGLCVQFVQHILTGINAG